MSDFDLEKFAKRFKELREEKGLSQEELGNLLFLSRQQISKYENGKSLPSISLIYQLANLYNISISSILNLEDLKKEKRERKILIICLISLLVYLLIELVLFIIALTHPISLGAFTTWVWWYKGFESVSSIIFLIFVYLNLALFIFTIIFIIVRRIYVKKRI